MVSNHSAIKTQIEYYLSDANLAKDKFFREQIQTDKEGFVAISHFLNCNNVKEKKWTADDIAAACNDSQQVEVKGLKIRRAGNKALPEKVTLTEKKRDQKAADKKEEEQEDEWDEEGKAILVEKDFDNPIILTYAAEVKDGEEFKVDWKQVEKEVKANFPKLKLIYSRMDPHGGHIAVSQLRIKREMLNDLCKNKMTVQERPFTFKLTEGEELKEFWQKQGGHFQFCIQNRLRAAKKTQKLRQVEKRESVKRAKTSFEIAGVYYLDINKVKSKSRAILNLKKDGEKLDGNDAEFILELLSFHDKKDKKLENFDHFEVGVHPSYDKTRCFFVVKKDGSKEDFSCTKCIMNLEKSV